MSRGSGRCCPGVCKVCNLCRNGINPHNHHRDNVKAIKAKSQANNAKREQDRAAEAAALPPFTPQLSTWRNPSYEPLLCPYSFCLCQVRRHIGQGVCRPHYTGMHRKHRIAYCNLSQEQYPDIHDASESPVQGIQFSVL